MRRAAFVLTILSLFCASRVSAQATLPIAEVAGGAITVDGLLRDWAAPMTSVGSGDDASMRFALAYDGEGLFVGAEVHDDRMVRTAHPGDDEDAVVVTLALPHGRGLSAVEVWLYAGVAGTSAAVVQTGALGARRRSTPRGAQIVEAPLSRGSGYTIEAFIPWSAIPGHDRLEDGRGSVRLRDVDQAAHPSVEAEPALVAVDRAHLESLLPLAPSNGETERLRGFLEPRGLSSATRPTHEWRIDVAEDATPEHVMILDRFVVVMGPSYQGGTGYGYAELGIAAAADLIRVEPPIDLTGDGHAELCVVLRQYDGAGSRDLFEVLSLSSPSLASIFDVEIRKATTQGSVDGSARIERGRRGALATIVQGAGTAHGLDASTLRESPPSEAQPLLVPWGPIAERTFRWSGQTFAQIAERPNAHYVDPAAAAAAHASASSSATESAPPPPSMDDVLAAFRREAGIGARVRPSFDRTGNLAGGPTPERALVFGRELVVVGPDFRDGTGWFRYQLPCEATDLLDFSLADLTGEGRSELLFRIRQTLGSGTSVVRREVLLVHMFTPTDFPAVLTREVAREREGNRIENQVLTTGAHLEIRPGTATGWTAASWPFSDAPPTDGIDAPLLPWRDHAVTFRFDHGHLVPR